MEKVAIINNLYFEQRKTLTEIAEIINTSISYISKTLRKNEMYKIEKEKLVLLLFDIETHSNLF